MNIWEEFIAFLQRRWGLSGEQLAKLNVGPGRGGKRLELTGIGVKRERFHIYKISHTVPMSNQTPFAPKQRCEGECWCLKTSQLRPLL